MPRRSKRNNNGGDDDQEPEQQQQQQQQGNSVSQVVRDRQRGLCCRKIYTLNILFFVLDYLILRVRIYHILASRFFIFLFSVVFLLNSRCGT
jgi:hypothetical protein